MNIAVSGIVLLVCIVFFIIFCFKGYSPIIVGLGCVVLLGLFSISGGFNAVFTILPEAIGSSFTDTFLIFASSSVFGLIFSETKCAATMGTLFSGRLKKQFIPFVIMGFSVLINVVGLPKGDFITAAFAFPLLAAADLPLYLGLVAGISMGTVIAWGLPGLPGLPNVLPAGIFGIDSLYVAPLAGWAMTIGGIIAAAVYLWILTKRAIKNNVGYIENGTEMIKIGETPDEDRRPSKFISVTPMIILLILAYLFNMSFGWDAIRSVVIAQFIANVYMIATGYRYFDKDFNVVKGITDAMVRIAPICLCIGFVTAFAKVASDTAIYESIMNGIFNLNIHPYFTVVIIVSVIAAITSDGISTLFILQSTDIAARLLATGADAGVMAILARAACAGFDTLPWSPTVILPLAIYGYTHKTGYKYSFVCTVALPFLMVGIGLIFGFLFY